MFFKIGFLEKNFQEYLQSVKQFGSRSTQQFVGPDVGPNCLQRLSAGNTRLLDSRSNGCGLEPHQWHCVVSLGKTHLSLLSTGSTQESRLDMTEKMLTGM